MSQPGPIGERLRALRQARQPHMTQRELAERSGISVDVISKLEQGSKQSALLTTLHRLANALDVNVSALLGEPVRVTDDSSDGEVGVVAIRRALLDRSSPSDDPPEKDSDLQRSSTFAWGAYWSGRYDNLGTALPGHIGAARSLHHRQKTPLTALALADAYAVTASTLVHLGEVDLAYLAMDRALSTAQLGEDPLYQAALNGWMSWLLLHQTGTLDQAHRLAAQEAARLRETMDDNDPRAVSVWGSLLISAAVAAARDEDAQRADDFLTEAKIAASRLQDLGYSDHRAYESTFGSAQVRMQAVDIAVVTDRPGHALDQARHFSTAGLPLAAQARHLADRANAYTVLGKDEEALEALLSIEHMAPHWMRYQTYPRTIILELIERERRTRTPRLRGLADRLGVLTQAY